MLPERHKPAAVLPPDHRQILIVVLWAVLICCVAAGSLHPPDLP